MLNGAMTQMNARSMLRQRRRDAVSDTLLDAAEHVIGREGYDGATMQDIAKEAGCAAGTLYLYFKTKEELFSAMAAKHAQAIMQLLYAAMDQVADPVEKLRLSYNAYLDYMHAHPGFFRIFYTSGPGSRASLQASLQGKALEVYRDYRRQEISLVSQAQQAGKVRADIPAEELVEFMHGIGQTACARWITGVAAPANAEQMRLLWEMIKSILGVKEKKH